MRPKCSAHPAHQVGPCDPKQGPAGVNPQPVQGVTPELALPSPPATQHPMGEVPGPVGPATQGQHLGSGSQVMQGRQAYHVHGKATMTMVRQSPHTGQAGNSSPALAAVYNTWATPCPKMTGIPITSPTSSHPKSTCHLHTGSPPSDPAALASWRKRCQLSKT